MTDLLPIHVLIEHLATFTYKETWRFSIHALDHKHGTFTISFYTRDAYEPSADRTVKIGRTFPLRPFLTLDQFEWWVLECVYHMEKHEAREWLRIDGIMKFDPHLERSR